MTTSIGILGAAAVQDDAVQVAQTLGLEVHVLAAAANGPAAQSADHFAAVDFSDVSAVADYARQHDLSVVYSTGSDLAIPVSAEVSERLGLPRFVSVETARTCNVKTEMRRALAGSAGNVPSLLVESIDSVRWEGRWPVIVKPADAQGQRGVNRVDSDQGLRGAVAEAMPHSRSGRVIVEEFIEGPEVSINGYLVDGELIFLTVSDRETWPDFVGLISSHVIPSAVSNEQIDLRIREMLTEATELLGISNGPVYAQVIIRDGVPFIIEITPRLDGCHMWKVIRHAQSVDLMNWTLRHLVFGEKPTRPITADGVRPVRLDFHCQAPHTAYQDCAYVPPADTVESYAYYSAGDTIRPVNGRFEKVGYDIRIV